MPAVTRRRLLAVVAAVLVFVAGVVALALWDTPPAWLGGPQRMTMAVLRWARIHLFTGTVAGLVATIAGVVLPVLLWRLDHRQPKRDAVEGPRRDRSRQSMLNQVRYRWIAGVLEQSLTEEVRIALGLARRSDVLQRTMSIRRPDGQSELLAAGTEVREVFEDIGRGLLILGVPGSGKTIALLELARDLLEDAEADQTEPVPVVFNLSSWAARRPPLDEWMVDELRASYDVPKRLATQWVADSEILPLLDGLDEVATTHRADCIEAINAFQAKQRAEDGLVQFAVCCRTEEYTALSARLRVEEALELQPPTPEQVSVYLQKAGDALTAVRAAVDADETLREFLQSPLVLNIVALTYRDRWAGALRTAGTREQRLALLFTAYIERMLERRHGRYSSARTLHWLSCLAQSMRQRSESEFYLDRLKPDWLPTSTQQRLATLAPTISAGLGVGLVLGLVAGLLGGLGVGLAIGLVAGLVFAFGLVSGLAGRLAEGELVEQVRLVRWSREARRHVLKGALTGARRAGLLGVLGFGLAFGLLSWLRGELSFALPGGLGLAGVLVSRLVGGSASGLVGASAFGLLSALVGAVVGAVTFALVNGLADERSTPNEGIHRSARYACAYGLAIGLVFGLADGLIVGLGVGLTVALRFGGLACLQHLAIRGLLARNGAAPLRYVGFLDDAKDRLFLRRTGSGYIFVHRLLFEHLAELDPARGAEPPGAPPARGVDRPRRVPEVGLPDG
ncbi:MAG: NACHT domain-containing protein [Stenotrophomonas sp.]|uniref:NACHT domain-containing protein n=1 Tax=Stenotrophomonas sp. TaxID=69392 RepID=UPI003D6D5F45